LIYKTSLRMIVITKKASFKSLEHTVSRVVVKAQKKKGSALLSTVIFIPIALERIHFGNLGYLQKSNDKKWLTG